MSKVVHGGLKSGFEFRCSLTQVAPMLHCDTGLKYRLKREILEYY